MVPTTRSAIALVRGAHTGVLMVLPSVAVKTASNIALNLASRSRIKNRKRRPASSRSMQRLRASWVSRRMLRSARPDVGEQAGFVGGEDGGAAAADAEFGVDGADVAFDGVDRHGEVGGDFVEGEHGRE